MKTGGECQLGISHKSLHKKVNDVVDRPENAGGSNKDFSNLGFIGHIDLLSPGGEEVQEDLLDVAIEFRMPYQVGSRGTAIVSGSRPRHNHHPVMASSSSGAPRSKKILAQTIA